MVDSFVSKRLGNSTRHRRDVQSYVALEADVPYSAIDRDGDDAQRHDAAADATIEVIATTVDEEARAITASLVASLEEEARATAAAEHT